MFIKIIKKLYGSIEVWLMKDNNNGMRLFLFTEVFEGDSIETIKDFVALMSDFPVFCLEESITTTPVDLDSILTCSF